MLSIYKERLLFKWFFLCFFPQNRNKRLIQMLLAGKSHRCDRLFSEQTQKALFFSMILLYKYLTHYNLWHLLNSIGCIMSCLKKLTNYKNNIFQYFWCLNIKDILETIQLYICLIRLSVCLYLRSQLLIQRQYLYNRIFYQSSRKFQKLAPLLLWVSEKIRKGRQKLALNSIYNYFYMISTKIQSVTGQLKNPFSGTQSTYTAFSGAFGQYKCTLQSQLQLLKRRFPNEDSNKIKDLLEQFDNDLEMVTEILVSSQDKNQMVCQKPTLKKTQLQDQNRMLKNAITTLYKKLVQQQKDLQALKQSQDKIKKQNQNLKLKNRLLLQGQFNNNYLEEERQVY